MFSNRSSVPTLLGCRPSARKSLGRSQKRFQLLTKSSFWSLHHDNNHLFKANSLLNLSCPRRYVGRGPDTSWPRRREQCAVSIRLLKSLFSVSVCRSLVSFTPACSMTSTLSSRFRIVGIWAETLMMESPAITAPRHVPSRREKRSSCGWRSRRPEGGRPSPGPESLLPQGPQGWSKGHLGRSLPGCTGPVQRNTRSRGGGRVSNMLYT